MFTCTIYMTMFRSILGLCLCLPLAGVAADVPAVPKSGVVQELWTGIPGGSVRDLTHSKAFESPAPDRRTITRLDAENLGDRYGARYSALLRVPATGEYRLYLASDDSAELWLGKDDTQKDMACIATVKGYSDRHNWSNQPNQMSAPVHLEAGKLYFLQVIHKEDGGKDHMSVAWSGPNIPNPVLIPESVLFVPPGMLPEPLPEKP